MEGLGHSPVFLLIDDEPFDGAGKGLLFDWLLSQERPE
jgi:hypothetical protein